MKESARGLRTELTRALDRYLDDRSGELSLSMRDLGAGIETAEHAVDLVTSALSGL
ncbi:MAG TPA: hypothetical protein VH912_05460 [Streptosporangiaceae bacterium]|jgi:hypothetical protein